MRHIPTSKKIESVKTKPIIPLSNTKREKTPEPGFIADVFFGSPLNNCAGHGICKLKDTSEDTPNNSEWTPCRTLAYISLRAQKWVKFQVLKITVSDRVRNRQFANNRFRVDCDFDMSPHFDTDNTLVISKGEYPVWEDDNFFILEILCNRK